MLPEKMICVEIENGKLTNSTRQLPTPKRGEVLIKVAAAGVNRADILQRQGKYPPPSGASDIPGLEIAGEVVLVGKGVKQPSTGDKIMALVSGGGYAEYCIAPAVLCLPIPPNLELDEAAAVPETFFTVFCNLFQRAKLKAGETLLVHGGSSGIGTTAIQMAHAFGSKVVVTAGNDDKCGACEVLGADLAINYNVSNFVEKVHSYTNGRGVDVILDMVGGEYVARNIEVLAINGRLISIASLRGGKAEIDLIPIMLKRLTITGSTLRTRSIDFKASIANNLMKKIWPLIEKEEILPFINATFLLEEATKAHELMQSSEHIGKIVLVT